MDFRDYDPAIARWTGIDPVTHHNMSPYMAFDGNPVFWADPSGADSVNGNTLDIFGRDKFDSNDMFVPFGDRGLGSFDAYLNEEASEEGGGDLGLLQDTQVLQSIILNIIGIISEYGSDGDDEHLAKWLENHPIVLIQKGDYNFRVEFQNLRNSPSFNFRIPSPGGKGEKILGDGLGYSSKKLLQSITRVPAMILYSQSAGGIDVAKHNAGQEKRRNQINNGLNMGMSQLLFYMFKAQVETSVMLNNTSSNYYNLWRFL
jgi:hypothetical protein